MQIVPFRAGTSASVSVDARFMTALQPDVYPALRGRDRETGRPPGCGIRRIARVAAGPADRGAPDQTTSQGVPRPVRDRGVQIRRMTASCRYQRSYGLMKKESRYTPHRAWPCGNGVTFAHAAKRSSKSLSLPPGAAA